MQFEDKVALITGGARGIGRGVALVLAERGADVALADLNLEGAEKTAEETAQFGRKAKGFQVDVTNSSQIERLVSEVLGAFAQIDILVNAAGVIGDPNFEDSTVSSEADWDITFDVNVKGTALMSDAVAPHMKERRFGKIINIASHAARAGSAGNAAYGASKAAVVHLTQSYALALAPYSINVNVICPGTLWTPMWERIAVRTIRNDPSKANMTPRQVFDEAIKAVCPLQREQTPEDIGKAAAFFASEDAFNITGQSLNVNGGTRMN